MITIFVVVAFINGLKIVKGSTSDKILAIDTTCKVVMDLKRIAALRICIFKLKHKY